MNPIKPHLALAKKIWTERLREGDIVLDSTCGNGHDTLFLAQQVLQNCTGKVYALDIQSQAIEKARELLKHHLTDDQLEHVHFIQGCHSRFPEEIPLGALSLIVYNLGYLPGSCKSIKTLFNTTLESLEKALSLICPGGLISVTCYPGHVEGKEEQEAILEWSKLLDCKKFSVCHHVWVNRPLCPSLLLIEKIL